MWRIERLQLPTGDEPFKIWVDELDLSSRARIFAYIDRVAAGGTKRNIKSLGDGVFEVKVDVGPRYRVYYGELDGRIILLLVGGDKKSQKRDIKLAKHYWSEYVQK